MLMEQQKFLNLSVNHIMLKVHIILYRVLLAFQQFIGAQFLTLILCQNMPLGQITWIMWGSFSTYFSTPVVKNLGGKVLRWMEE